MKAIALVLIVLGALALVYGGVNYNRDRTVLKMGSMSVTATEHKSIPIPALAGVVVLVGGVALLALGPRRSRTA